MDSKPPQPFERLDREIAEIDEAVAKLLERKRHLVRLRSGVWAERCLRPGDRVTEKNAKKFNVLGSVYYELVINGAHGNQKGLSSLELFRRAGNGDLNYDTFRSYLHRFKNEKRLAYDERNGIWKLDTTTEGKPENN